MKTTVAQLGDKIDTWDVEHNPESYTDFLESVRTQGFQTERLLTWSIEGKRLVDDVVVQFLGSDEELIAEAVAREGNEIMFFAKSWYDEDTEIWDWSVINEEDADYYSMVLIGGKYWAFAPSYFPFVPKCEIISFEEAEEIENKLLARAS